jgi:uncharacterized membrane protein YphA (DoxX/SURF4 family)
MKKKIILLIRIALGAVFVYASIDKIMHPADFSVSVYYYQLLPNELINLTALILPWLELVLGVCLIIGVWQQGALFLANFLLIMFTAALIFNLARGLDIHCGCFTAKAEIVEGGKMIWTIVRDTIFLLMGLVLFADMVIRTRKNSQEPLS